MLVKGVTGGVLNVDYIIPPIRHEALFWNNPGSMLFAHFGRDFGDIWIKTQQFSYAKLKVENVV